MTQAELVRLLPERPGLLLLDFDGVLTDNFTWTDERGRESVRCSKEDSLGLALVRRAGLPVAILSSEENPVVRRRAAKLRVACWAGVADKGPAFERLVEEYQVNAAGVVYVGNDVNDVPCLRRAGCGLVVADAHPRAAACARGVLGRPGGRGAVREVCEALLIALAALAEGAHPERVPA